MLNEEYVRELVSKGETTTVQVKRNVNNKLSSAQEMVAFANTKGGTILKGWMIKPGKSLD